jgi:hypothetical protein
MWGHRAIVLCGLWDKTSLVAWKQPQTYGSLRKSLRRVSLPSTKSGVLRSYAPEEHELTEEVVPEPGVPCGTVLHVVGISGRQLAAHGGRSGGREGEAGATTLRRVVQYGVCPVSPKTLDLGAIERWGLTWGDVRVLLSVSG